METIIDKWIMSIPDGRNDRCPCGCGTKMKKVALNPEPHFEEFKKQKENKNYNCKT